MEVTNYLPFRCILFIDESTLIVGVCQFKNEEFFFIRRFFIYLKGHEFAPLIYNYDSNKSTIQFIEKLDREEPSTGRTSIGLEF